MPLLKPIVATVVLALAYVFGYRLHALQSIHPRRWLSFGAGVSVAYVFVELLPELGEYQQRFLAATLRQEMPLVHRHVFLAALLGFVFYYGLDHLVSRSRASTPARAEEGHSLLVYRLHVAGFAAYSALIGYVLVRGPDRALFALALYTLAMFLHFLGLDHALDREHPRRYRRRGRWFLSAVTGAGALVGFLTSIPDLFLATLMGLIAGGVVVNSMVMELPKEKEGRFWAFCLGAFLYSLILLLA
jgi:multisubunit Na+/H+ antiporter MnhB subunit